MNSSQAVISFKGKHCKTDPRTQFGALCYRRADRDKVQVLLITGRRTGRWRLPKGWPKMGLTPAQSAKQEAYEEAGVMGESHEMCLGHYVYAKTWNGRTTLPCIVAVFPVRFTRFAKKFPETGERELVWLSPKKAAKMVEEPSLKTILRRFDPAEIHH